MLRSFQMLGAVLILALAGNAMAEMKIAVVDIARILEESPQAQKARTQLEKEFAPKEQKLKAIQDKIIQLEQKMARDGAIMSESQRTSLERDIIAERRDFKRTQEEIQEDLNFKRRQLLQNLEQEVGKAIEEYSKANKYDLVLSQGIVYWDEKIDVTDAILKKLKK